MQSARVGAVSVAPGVIEASYYGFITHEHLPAAYRQVVRSMVDERAAIVRTDTALMALRGLPAITPLMAPVAFVVSPDQFDYWTQWAAMVAREFGQVRTVFLAQHLDLARRWAEDRALAVASRLLPCRQSRPRPYRVDRSACQTIGQSPALPA
jgi:hypothetical protein